MLLPWATVPFAIVLVRTVLRGTAGRELNVVLKRSGQLQLLFGVLWAAGWLV